MYTPNQNRAFDAMFERHGDGYLVFGKHGGARFSAEERDAYVAAHRRAKPGWKSLAFVVVSTVGVGLIATAAINAMLRLRPAISPNLVVTTLVTVGLTHWIVQMVVVGYPPMSLILRIRREADRRPPVVPPRETRTWRQMLPNWIAGIGFIGFQFALVFVFVFRVATPIWPWVLVGCPLAVLVCYVQVDLARRRRLAKVGKLGNVR